MSDIKQVKIDNWGIFFLQRLQQFFNRTDFCDLTLQFENNVQLKVHRLVMNACTEYFQILENTCDVVDDCLIMPLDLQPDVVVPIVNFMYTGQLEFQMSHYDKLYAAAKLMNLTVLTKLLDAQKVPVSPLAKPLHKRTSVGAVTWNLQGKKIVPKTMDPDLPEPLPGRKLPVWKRKTIPTSSFRASTSDFISENIVSSFKSTTTPTPKVLDNTPRPTRFEWPEDEIPSTDLMVSSFDDISYGSQPLAAPIIKSNSMNNSSAAFEEIKKNTIKRPATSYNHHNSPVNLQDVKEYLQEQKLRNDYILRNEERNSASQNEDSNDNIEYRDENSSQGELIFGNIKEENPNKSILKPSSNDEDHSPAKKVRFSLEGKENATKGKKSIIEAKVKVESGDLTNHTKIISEVLKKYPYLMQKNKNIKLKIMQKNQSSNEISVEQQAKKIKIIKSNEKIVEEKQSSPQETQLQVSKCNNSSEDEGIKEYKCKECNIPNEYIQLQSYPEYHDHMVEFHPERIDARICEHCGHRSTRRHLLLYHQLTKHGINPPAPFVFPQCDICDYVAINKMLLKRHQTGVHGTTKSLSDEKTSRIICQTCKATFKRNLLFIKHCHQTGHNEDLNFDCEYCHKKFLQTSYVIAHMKSYHKPELEQENINLDEIESTKPEIEIISNIPINTSMEDIDNKTEVMVPTTSGPSSEAEALVNVASGIAASLGLVVLDENQFVIQTQDDCTGTEEYILPEISEEDGTLVHQTPQTIALTVSDQQTANNIVTTSTPVTTTDELVMVLTDHDYSDGNTPIITSENSNIVVLYSHPVEGQSTQYISPEGNIVLNSQTGVIEMNGQKLHVTNAEQLEIKSTETEDVEKSMEIEQEQEVVEPEVVESIEMIQQEIDNHFQVTEKLNQEIIQHSNAVSEILSSEIQSQSTEQVTVQTADDLAKTLEDKDENEPTEEQNEVISQQIEEEAKEEESISVNTKTQEPESMEVDEEINNEVVNIDNQKIDNVTNKENIESISEELEPPSLEPQPSEIQPPPTSADDPPALPLPIETSTPTIEINDKDKCVIESNIPSDEAMDIDEADNSVTKKTHPESDVVIAQPIEEAETNTTDVQITENIETNDSSSVKENESKQFSEQNETKEKDDTEKVNTETIKDVIKSENAENNEVVQISEITEGEAKVEETQTDNEKINEIIEEDDTTKNLPNETKESEVKTDEDIVPKEENIENETVNEASAATKDNVTSLVSDWCDDDSGLQANNTEIIQQTTETNETMLNETNQFIIPTTREQNNDKENKKGENGENKASNIKITKLLDDWDDGDTDSQNSGENTQQVTKNPINNLIEDWDDE